MRERNSLTNYCSLLAVWHRQCQSQCQSQCHSPVSAVSAVSAIMLRLVALTVFSLLLPGLLSVAHPHPQLENGFPFLSFLTSRLYQTKNRPDRRHHQPQIQRHQSKPCIWPIECGYGARKTGEEIKLTFIVVPVCT